jgi:hypothetical protein
MYSQQNARRDRRKEVDHWGKLVTKKRGYEERDKFSYEVYPDRISLIQKDANL